MKINLHRIQNEQNDETGTRHPVADSVQRPRISRRIRVVTITVVLILLCAAAVSFCVLHSLKPPMLTQKENRIVSMDLKTSHGIMHLSDQKNFETFYSAIEKTKTSVHAITDAKKTKLGLPAFTLVIHYRDGKEDIIASDSKGAYVYRILDIGKPYEPLYVSVQRAELAGRSFVGGDNSDVMPANALRYL